MHSCKTSSIRRLKFAPGDVIGFSGWDATGFWINVGTLGIPFWDLSHIGIIGTDGLLYESTTMLKHPCAVLGKFIRGTQAQCPVSRIQNYNGICWHYKQTTPLSPMQRIRLGCFLRDNLGKKYDALGAFRSRTLVTGPLLRKLCPHEENLATIFCSEYVVGALEATKMLPETNCSIWNPNRAARLLRRKRLVRRRRRIRTSCLYL